MKVRDQEIDGDGPTKDLKTREGYGEHVTSFCPVHHAARRVPIPDRNEEGHRRCNNGEEPKKEKDNGYNGECQCDAVVERPVILQILDFTLCLSCFQTDRAEMFAVQFAVAQRAHESAAALAREHGLLGGMIETGGFAIDQNDFTRFGRPGAAEQSGKNFDPQQVLTSVTRREVRLIESPLDERRSALGTYESGTTLGANIRRIQS